MTFLPASASVTARLATVTLLPSPCRLLVTSSDLALPSTSMKAEVGAQQAERLGDRVGGVLEGDQVR